MAFEPFCQPTGIGSLPHTDLNSALRLTADTVARLPYVPQLPALSWHEGMIVQPTEGLPGRVLDEEREKIHLDTEPGPAALEEFYGRVIAEDPEGFAISEDHCRGLSGLLRYLAETGADADLVGLKAQITGPVTLGLSLVDQTKRAIYYNETFQEAVVKSCAMKARWLVRRLKGRHCRVILFVDEPILSAFGSSVYVSVRREEVVAQIKEVVEAISAEGAIPGVHCCGNTDWTLVTDTGADVLSFDAFEFAHSLALYPEAIRRFVDAGGIIAWGVVPTSSTVRTATVDSLAARLDEAMAHVEKLGVQRETLVRQALLTPACGLGSATLDVAETAFRLLGDLSVRMRREMGKV